MTPVIALVALVLLLFLLASSVKIIKQYEQGVLFRFGRVIGLREPGLRLLTMAEPATATATTAEPRHRVKRELS